jgi:hypothetical protein
MPLLNTPDVAEVLRFLDDASAEERLHHGATCDTSCRKMSGIRPLRR